MFSSLNAWIELFATRVFDEENGTVVEKEIK
jgi:hypothetical protein